MKFKSNWRSLVEFNKSENRESLWIFIETLAISSAISLQNKPAFFILITPIVIWKAVRFYRDRQFLSNCQLFFRFQNVVIWIVYHFTFLYLYIYEWIVDEDRSNISQSLIISWNNSGYVIIGCIVFGGLFNVIQFLF